MTLETELLVRLAVGTLLGSIIGYERHLHGRPAGLRTHLLVALASTTFMLVSTHDEHRVHVAFVARIPQSSSDTLLELLESQAGITRLRVESLT